MLEPLVRERAEGPFVAIPEPRDLELVVRLEGREALEAAVPPERGGESFELARGRLGEKAVAPRVPRRAQTAGHALGSERFKGLGESGFFRHRE